MTTDREELAHARSLYRENKLRESEAAFRALLDSAPVRAEAAAGLAMIKLRQNDFTESARLFASSLEYGANADAHYGLGVIAERNGALDQALAHFSDAVVLNENHEGARKRLQLLSQRVAAAQHPQHADDGIPGRQAQEAIHPHDPGADLYLGSWGREPHATQPPTASSPSPANERGDQAAFYQILGTDRSELSEQALRLIDTLSVERSPRMSAYPLSIMVLILGFVVVAALLMLVLSGTIR